MKTIRKYCDDRYWLEEVGDSDVSFLIIIGFITIIVGLSYGVKLLLELTCL